MALALFLDWVGEIAKAPVLVPVNLAFILIDDLCHVLDKRLNLLRRDIRTGHEHLLVKRHCIPFLYMRRCHRESEHRWSAHNCAAAYHQAGV